MDDDDLSITRIHNGAIQISSIVNGYRLCRTYYDYTQKEAVALYKEEVKKEMKYA